MNKEKGIKTYKISLGRRQTLVCLFLLFLISFFLCIKIGSVKISISDMLNAMVVNSSSSYRKILLYSRIPRVFACMLAGAGLSVAGVIIQNVLSNPLAGPNIIGVNSGAGFMVVLFSSMFPAMYNLVPIAAFIGAFIALIFVFYLSYNTGASKITIILAGVCVNSMFNAATDLLHTFGEDTLNSTYGFRLGGFTSIQTNVLIPAGIIIVIVILITVLLSNELEILSLGDEVAASVGLNVKCYRLIFLLMAAALAGASVSFAGLIGFVGLIVPHVARKIIGEESTYLIIFSALAGGVFVMICDLIARTAWSPYEVPTGIILSFIGAPFFLYLLVSRKKRRNHDNLQ